MGPSLDRVRPAASLLWTYSQRKWANIAEASIDICNVTHKTVTDRIAVVLWVVWGAVASAVMIYAAQRGAVAYGDERAYLDLASSLTSGSGYEFESGPTAYRPPVWPVVLALSSFLVPVPNLAAVSAALLAAASLVARRIGDAVGGDALGWIVAFAVLAYPLNVYTAATLYPQILATFLTLVMIAAVVVWSNRSAAMPVIIGLSGALLLLAVPISLFTVGMVVLWATWRNKARWLSFGLILTVAFAVPVGAWMARNYVQFDRFIPVSTATGVNLLLGNNPNATSSSGIGADISAYRSVGEIMPEYERSQYYSGEAIRWVRDNPADAAWLYIKKTGNYFVPYNEPRTQGADSPLAAIIAWVTFVPLLLLAVLRFAIRRRKPLVPPEGLIWMLFIGNAPFMAIAFTRTRFRLPLDSLLIIEAGVLVLAAIGYLASLRSNRDGELVDMQEQGPGRSTESSTQD